MENDRIPAVALVERPDDSWSADRTASLSCPEEERVVSKVDTNGYHGSRTEVIYRSE